MKKEKNFFETRVIEYQNGGALSWDNQGLPALRLTPSFCAFQPSQIRLARRPE
ncbi:hypothetical protein [Bradyrhizobium sp. Ai1a-2]|uniref:hypothetical protein n=1 Tax=Bradyrhizobium sp. Ai1a-2 TaxID=196490 RepID=UPI001916DB5C|nr:hypothetical protein [Bradyrhizobium sp. Ai1a-2]